jgi:hypothetical protein
VCQSIAEAARQPSLARSAQLIARHVELGDLIGCAPRVSSLVCRSFGKAGGFQFHPALLQYKCGLLGRGFREFERVHKHALWRGPIPGHPRFQIRARDAERSGEFVLTPNRINCAAQDYLCRVFLSHPETLQLPFPDSAYVALLILSDYWT